jgi:cytochrome c oxidase subunit 2
MDPGSIFLLFLGIAVLIAAVFTATLLSTRRPREQPPAARLRGPFFLALVSALAIAFALTLPRLPYAAEADTPDRVVHVAGKQFAFALSAVPITTTDEWERSAATEEVQVPLGALVEFRVTSLDVNHGFTLYSPGGELLAQTQAMPGYVNRLRVRFKRPGQYTALCLEYCGMSHHVMRGVVDVR